MRHDTLLQRLIEPPAPPLGRLHLSNTLRHDDAVKTVLRARDPRHSADHGFDRELAAALHLLLLHAWQHLLELPHALTVEPLLILPGAQLKLAILKSIQVFALKDHI